MNQSKLVRQPNAQISVEHALGRWHKPTITGLEADLAYFNARLEFINTPTTINQKIQQVVFRTLIQSTTRILNHMRQFQSQGS